MDVKTVTVLGAGTMGHGIAHAAMVAGFETVLYDVSQPQLDNGRSAIDAVIQKGVDLGKVSADDALAMRGRLRLTTAVADAVRDADLVTEGRRSRST